MYILRLWAPLVCSTEAPGQVLIVRGATSPKNKGTTLERLSPWLFAGREHPGREIGCPTCPAACQSSCLPSSTLAELTLTHVALLQGDLHPSRDRPSRGGGEGGLSCGKRSASAGRGRRHVGRVRRFWAHLGLLPPQHLRSPRSTPPPGGGAREPGRSGGAAGPSVRRRGVHSAHRGAHRPCSLTGCFWRLPFSLKRSSSTPPHVHLRRRRFHGPFLCRDLMFFLAQPLVRVLSVGGGTIHNKGSPQKLCPWTILYSTEPLSTEHGSMDSVFARTGIHSTSRLEASEF